jgi:hypothetical protein
MAVVGAAILAACGAPSPVTPTVVPVGPLAEVGKLTVDEPGPVAITPADLLAIGWGDVPLEQVQVIYRDQIQPVWVTAQAVRFMQPHPTRYMTSSVYFLKRGSSPKLPERAAIASGAPVETYLGTVRAEQNKIYAPQAAGDTWFWERVTAPATRTSLTFGGGRWPSSAEAGGRRLAQPVRTIIMCGSVSGATQRATWDGSVRRLVGGGAARRSAGRGRKSQLCQPAGRHRQIRPGWVEVYFARRFVA